MKKSTKKTTTSPFNKGKKNWPLCMGLNGKFKCGGKKPAVYTKKINGKDVDLCADDADERRKMSNAAGAKVNARQKADMMKRRAEKSAPKSLSKGTPKKSLKKVKK